MYKRGKTKVVETEVDETKCQYLPHLIFSEEAKRMLQDLFTHYPPYEGEERKEIEGKVGGKINKSKQMRDDIFCKPLLSKADIAKKVETLATRRESIANLRLVFYLNILKSLLLYNWLYAVCWLMFCSTLSGKPLWFHVCRFLKRGPSFQFHPSGMSLQQQ